MPSDSVAGFLDRAQASRVLFPEQVELLIRQPDIPHSDLSALCDYLLSRGVLTRFQASAIRESNVEELAFAGYPVIDVIGPCPGGTAYKVLHPSLRTPLVLRRIRPQWLSQADSVEGYLQRAKSIGMLDHPNLIPVLDAGCESGEIYVVIDYPADAMDLESLAAEVGGAMPGFLAAEYGRSIASALNEIHDRGVHGEVRPGNLIVSPVTTKKNPDGSERRRPAANAVVKVAEAGLIPLHMAASLDPPEKSVAVYLPPEYLNHATPTHSGDIYGLGASLYFLLSGRPPFEGRNVSEILQSVRSQEPASLELLRPDLPPELTVLVARMMSRASYGRPKSMSDVETALRAFCRPLATTTAPKPAGEPITVSESHNTTDTHNLVAIPVSDDAPAADDANVWENNTEAFASAHAEAPAAPRKREMSAEEKRRSRLLIICGAVLHLSAITLFVLWIAGAFHSTPEPEQPSPPSVKKENPSPSKKKKHN